MKDLQSQRIYELDALRGIAAFAVILFHLTIGRPEAKIGFVYGVTGVDLFFIISGFVILLTLERTKTWKDFLFSRFSRLYPTYWFCVTLTAIAILINSYLSINEPKPGLSNYLINLTMFQKYFRVANLDGSYWTMTIEMIFYLFMLVVFVSGRLKKIELIGLICLIPTAVYSFPSFSTQFSFVYNILRAGFPLINHFPLFLAGIIFYKIKFEGFSAKRILFLLLCFACQLSLFDDGGASKNFMSLSHYSVCLIFYFSIFSLYIAGKLAFIATRITVFLGIISYSLYLIHQYICVKLLIPLFTGYGGLNFLLAAGISVILVLAMAYLICTYIEKPSVSALRKLYKKSNSQNT